jgi:hypothetical protein
VSSARTEGSGGPGHLQRVANTGQFNRVQRTYRAYIDHAADCPVCAVDSTECADAGALWSAYQETTA